MCSETRRQPTDDTVRIPLAQLDLIVAHVRELSIGRAHSRLILDTGSEELDRLVAALNHLLGGIETSMDSARRFALDASHQLQGPLAALRAVIETYLRTDMPSMELRSLAPDMLIELDRLSSVVRDLGVLARVEGGHLESRLEPLALAPLCAECCEVAQALAEANRVRVEAALTVRPTVLGSSGDLRRAVLNLLQAAVRLAPPDSTIQVSIAVADQHAVVTVHDEGADIDPADLRHVFDRFPQLHRASAVDRSGTGLELAIVERVAIAHGGRVGVASAPGAGCTLSLYLPMAPLISRQGLSGADEAGSSGA